MERAAKSGDMITIPANTPHTFTEITTDQIVYMVVRVDPKKVLMPIRDHSPKK